MADKTEIEVKLSHWESFKLSLSWVFYDEIQWFKTLFTFRNKEQRAIWKAEMKEAEIAPRLRVTEETTWCTPRIANLRATDPYDQGYGEDPDPEEFGLNEDVNVESYIKSLFKSTFSLRAYFKDIFSGWNAGWEKRAEAIYRGDV